MKADVDYDRLVPINEMAGEDEEETLWLKKALEDARHYLLGQCWCRSIKRELFGLGIGGVVSVFLFEIIGDPGVDDLLWVVSGDLPPAYLVTDAAPTPTAALEVYCSLMDDWVKVVRQKGDLKKVYPVSVDPTLKNASQLAKRIAFLRREVVPAFS